MKQNNKTIFICLTMVIFSYKCNKICRDYSEATPYAKVAYNMATQIQEYQEQLDQSVVEILELQSRQFVYAQNEGVTQDQIQSYKYSLNVYKLTNDPVHKAKRDLLEANLRYMLFFRDSFDFKYLTDNGCYIKEDNGTQYIILQFPAERVTALQWFAQFQVSQTDYKTFLFTTKEELQKVYSQQNYERKVIGFNPFFSMDICLQFLISVAKMHQKNILHLNLKPYNLKLLNRFTLILDNFENALFSNTNEFTSSQNFSENNPYNGKNAVNDETNQFDFTDDLHAAGLVIYQLCTFRTLPNDQLDNEIKNGFESFNQATNQSLLEQTKQWCGQIVYNLLNSNGRYSELDLGKFEVEEPQTLSDGEDAVRNLIEIMIEMRQQYQDEFIEYYQQKKQYLNGQNLSPSNLTQLVEKIVSQDEIDDNNFQSLFVNLDFYQRQVKNIFAILPTDSDILDTNTQFEVPQMFGNECQDEQDDLSLQCLDQLLKIKVPSNTQENLFEQVNFKQEFQESTYENAQNIQVLDQLNDGYGFGYGDTIFNSTNEQKQFNNERYLMI